MPTVLVVDDDMYYGPFLKRYLKKLEFDAIVLKRGDQALHLIKFVRPDLVLLDLVLPGLSSEKTAERTQERRRHEGYPGRRDLGFAQGGEGRSRNPVRRSRVVLHEERDRVRHRRRHLAGKVSNRDSSRPRNSM